VPVGPAPQIIVNDRVDRVRDRLDRAVAEDHIEGRGVGAAKPKTIGIAGLVLVGRVVDRSPVSGVQVSRETAHVVVAAVIPALVRAHVGAVVVAIGRQILFAGQVGATRAVLDVAQPDHAAVEHDAQANHGAALVAPLAADFNRLVATGDPRAVHGIGLGVIAGAVQRVAVPNEKRPTNRRNWRRSRSGP